MKLWLRLILTAALAVILCSGFGMVYKAAPQRRGAAPAPAQAPTGSRKERLEAQMAFPGHIKEALNNWRVGLRRAIDNKDYLIVQGRGPRNLLATLYFDPDTGLLRRMVRYGPSPVGRVPTQIDYTDYRDVNGIKFPFEYQFSWLDGRYSAKIKDVKTNVSIDAARFGRPASK